MFTKPDVWLILLAGRAEAVAHSARTEAMEVDLMRTILKLEGKKTRYELSENRLSRKRFWVSKLISCK